MSSFFTTATRYVLIGTLTVTAVFGSSAVSVSAASASLYFQAPAGTIGVGDEFSVPILLDSGGTSVNTVSGDMTFSDPLLVLESVNTGNSIVSAWVEPPVISGNSVTFSGIMPGGYDTVVEPLSNTHTNGTVLTLVFRAKDAGSAKLSFSDSHVYLNDGQGTETSVAALPYTLTIAPSGSGLSVPSTDTLPPEAFTPVVSASPDLFNGAYALFFGTTDKGVGMDHYEVREGSGVWVRADSPYLLNDQSLTVPVEVKAIDRSGNYRIESVDTVQNSAMAIMIVPLMLLTIVLLIIRAVYMRRLKKHHSAKKQ